MTTDTTTPALDDAALDRLDALAQAATPGRWHIVLGSGRNLCTGIAAEFADGGNIFVADCWPDYVQLMDAEAAEDESGPPHDHRPTMDYIAACSPDVIRALVSALRAAQADAARLDWMERTVHGTGRALSVGGACYWSVMIGRARLGEGDDLRGAVDDAMEKEAEIVVAEPTP